MLTGDFKNGNCKENGLQKGNSYTYTDAIEVLPEYPKLSLTARYIIREDNQRGSTKPLDRRQKVNFLTTSLSIILIMINVIKFQL